MSKDNPGKTYNVKPIILIMIVSLVVGIGSGWIINILTEKKPRLTYDITTQEVFSGSANDIGIFGIRISNTGKKEIEDVLTQLVFSEADISEYRISGMPDASRKTELSGSSFAISFPYLNPQEQVSIQILLKPTTKSLSAPLIDIRGKGVAGSLAKKESQSKNRIYGLLSVAIAAFATLLTAASISLTSLRKRIELLFEKRHHEEKDEVEYHDADQGDTDKVEYHDADQGDTDEGEYHDADQRDTVAFALEAKGLIDEAKYVRLIPRNISYWSIVDSLVSVWLKRNEKSEIEKAIAALSYLTEYAAIADRSKQIINLNISRLAMAIDAKALASKHLNMAIENDSIILQKRISQYPELTSMIGDKVLDKANPGKARTSRG